MRALGSHCEKGVGNRESPHLCDRCAEWVGGAEGGRAQTRAVLRPRGGIIWA